MTGPNYIKLMQELFLRLSFNSIQNFHGQSQQYKLQKKLQNLFKFSHNNNGTTYFSVSVFDFDHWDSVLY